MSHQRNRRRLSVQPLETRKLMAGDAVQPVDDALATEEEHQEVSLLLPAVQAARESADSGTGTHNYTSGGIFTITVTVVDDDTGQTVGATDAVMARYETQDSADTADADHKDWINLLSVSQSITRPIG